MRNERMYANLMEELNKLEKWGIATYETDEDAKVVEIMLLTHKIENGEVVEKNVINILELPEDYEIDPENEYDEITAENFLTKVIKYHKEIDEAKDWTFDWCENQYDLLVATGTFDEFMEKYEK